jgi:hypothetical protein
VWNSRDNDGIHLPEIGEQIDIVMPEAEWEAFCTSLDAPPRSIPTLKKLLEEPGVFDGPHADPHNAERK